MVVPMAAALSSAWVPACCPLPCVTSLFLGERRGPQLWNVEGGSVQFALKRDRLVPGLGVCLVLAAPPGPS